MTSAIQVRAEDLPILVSLAHGHSWTTACDLAQLTPEQRRQTASRLRLAIEPANGRVRNLGHLVAALAQQVVTNPCADPRCGKPITGRPRQGWVKVDGAWYCGWDCVATLARERRAS